MENRMGIIERNLELLKQYTKTIDSDYKKLFEINSKIEEIESKMENTNFDEEEWEKLDYKYHELVGMFEQLEYQLIDKYKTNDEEEILSIEMFNVLCDGKKMIEFSKYAAENNCPLNLEEEQLVSVSESFSCLDTVNFDSLYEIDQQKFASYGNSYDYEEMTKELIREYDICLEIYKKNGLTGLTNLELLDEYVEWFNFIYSLINGGQGFEEAGDIDYELGKELIFCLTDDPFQYNLSPNELAGALVYNYCFFEKNPETGEIQLRKDPGFMYDAFVSYMQQEYGEDWEEYCKENCIDPWSSFGHISTANQESKKR